MKSFSRLQAVLKGKTSSLNQQTKNQSLQTKSRSFSNQTSSHYMEAPTKRYFRLGSLFRKKTVPTQFQRTRHPRNLEDHLYLIQPAQFQPKALMNKAEYALFAKLSTYLEMHHSNFYLFPQVVLGALFDSLQGEAFDCIKSKRADFVIVDPRGYPRILIEYQGSGHHETATRAILSDAVKKEVCRKTGVAFLEFFAGYTEADVKRITSWLR
ncbi:MAG: DUF2726 domain-containing protein [Neisseriaceae bacterium]